MHKLFTIGHSTHTTERFIGLLSMHKITAVCDVRSSPYSKFNPQFNRETLRNALKEKGIAYVYLGKELGPRSDDPECYTDGRVDYNRLAEKVSFQEGLDRIRTGMKSYRIALMCSEKDPVICHRMILICRHLRKPDLGIRHILEDGSSEDNRDSEKRLMKLMGIPLADLFDTEEDLIRRAYEKQSKRIAYTSSE